MLIARPKSPTSSTRTDSSTATTHPALFLLSFNLAALFVQHLSATELEPEPEPCGQSQAGTLLFGFCLFMSLIFYLDARAVAAGDGEGDDEGEGEAKTL